MAVDTSFRQESLSLYNFMCQHIVGSEEAVRTKRLMLVIGDNLNSDYPTVTITSGSLGEGLETKESDIDHMIVEMSCIVHEDAENAKFHPEKLNLVMEMKDTKPGFALLRCVNSPITEWGMDLCTHNGKAWYMSSEMVKRWMLNIDLGILTKIHGPCVSDDTETVDIAFCVHNPNWIEPADDWIHRENTSWPVSDVKSDIIDHGVLLVPIGCKGSSNEALEWRISFSVAEKLLIYSFCHTQLVCYALMKILLKDLINNNKNCKDLLCSYFIKTIIFWVSEETAVSAWSPQNTIRCFMKCFRRLMYTLEYSICPHYFMPTINMFENRIEGQSRQLLLEHVQTLLSFGWGCVLFSEKFHYFSKQLNVMASKAEINKMYLEKIVTSKILQNFSPSNQKSYTKCIGKVYKTKSSFIKAIYVRYLSLYSEIMLKSSTTSPSHTNKNIYYQYRKDQTYILQHVNHYAVDGWLTLATVFYNLKQYKKSRYILNYVTMKCYRVTRGYKLVMNSVTPENLHRSRILSILKLCFVNKIQRFNRHRPIPEELALDMAESPNLSLHTRSDVFAMFLRFLCDFHQNDRKQCNESINSLKRRIDETVFIEANIVNGMSYNMLGIALQLVGQNYLAKQAFTNATKYDSYYNSAAKRLMMMHRQMI